MSPRSVVAAVTLFCLALAAPAQAGERGLDLRGLVVGAPTTTEDVSRALGVRCGVGYRNAQVCNGQVSFGPVSADVNAVISPTGALRRIALTFSSSSFEDMEDGLQKKFGKPDEAQDSQVQNRFGARFDQRIVVWRGAGGALMTLTQRAGTFDKSSLLFDGPEDRAHLRSIQESVSVKPSDL